MLALRPWRRLSPLICRTRKLLAGWDRGHVVHPNTSWQLAQLISFRRHSRAQDRGFGRRSAGKRGRKRRDPPMACRVRGCEVQRRRGSPWSRSHAESARTSMKKPVVPLCSKAKQSQTTPPGTWRPGTPGAKCHSREKNVTSPLAAIGDPCKPQPLLTSSSFPVKLLDSPGAGELASLNSAPQISARHVDQVVLSSDTTARFIALRSGPIEEEKIGGRDPASLVPQHAPSGPFQAFVIADFALAQA